MRRQCCVQTELDSFLIEISALILAFKDEDGQPLVNKILDKTGMKGTGIYSPNCNLLEGPGNANQFCTTPYSQRYTLTAMASLEGLSRRRRRHVLAILDSACHSSLHRILWKAVPRATKITRRKHSAVWGFLNTVSLL